MEQEFDLDDYLGGETRVKLEHKGRIQRHYLVEMDAETDLRYQQRLQKTAAHGAAGNQTLSDEALTTFVWLYDKLCKKVEVEVGDKVVEVNDFGKKITPRVKRLAIVQYLMSVKPAEEERGN